MWYIIASSIIVVGCLAGLVIAIKLAMKSGKKLFPIILSMLLIAAISSLYFSINYYIEKKKYVIINITSVILYLIKYQTMLRI